MDSRAISKSSLLNRAFPVPRTLIMSEVSVGIYDGELRFSEVVYSHGSLVPKNFGVIDFPELRMEDQDQKSRDEAIEKLSSFSMEKGYRAVRVLIHEDEAYVFQITVPSTDVSTFTNAVESSLEENVPLSPSDALFEYEIVSTDEERGETLLSVTVVSQKTISSHADILGFGGLFPVSFETEARALSRALVMRGDTGVHALLHIGRKHSFMAIIEKGIVSFSSSINVGSKDIISAVSKSLNMSLPDTEKFILENGFEIGKEDMRIFDASMPVLSTFHDEIGKMLVYWKARSRKGDVPPISDIILSGKYSLMNGIAKYMSVTSQLPTRVGSVWTNILDPKELPPTLTEQESLDYGSFIGALITR
ncbi:MAG: hypothetical protein COV01_00840 [Candidatus Taylorbacteria bacterium CG10_big_fil_rev_8_21_14_0_10_41_48]|uniref:SHS2 domain-containing protein n=1 Tax=Candidatus Taylorbacteria bacterium CG10_big_fil_rev_8_21_14_0_10_41_48 TaxID=1975024 RepID=A0A2M8LD73_9BACT|nr:MAG: hypothetical protein COV01_00840 [Candidatus Taylorbacteria bacterium CG10_big_fil_rev_8_21_14_0_10_41_48]